MSLMGRVVSSFRGPTAESITMAMKTAQTYIDDNAVVVFSKSTCGFCMRTENLLKSKYPEASVKILQLDEMGEEGRAIQKALAEITKSPSDPRGQTTVPNIFINHKHIPGGSSGLQALEDRGSLRGLLEEAGAI